MKELIDGGPAFPSDVSECDGMSMRDYLAAKALQGLLNATVGTPHRDEPIPVLFFNGKLTFNAPQSAMDYAELSYSLADAMLKARWVQQ